MLVNLATIHISNNTGSINIPTGDVKDGKINAVINGQKTQIAQSNGGKFEITNDEDIKN